MKRHMVFAVLFSVVLALTGCGGSTGNGSGRLTLQITDAPLDEVSHVWIKFNSIEINGVGSVRVIDVTDLGIIDLAALTEGTAAKLLDGVKLEAGSYQWIRLNVNLLEEATTPTPADYSSGNFCYVEAGGTNYPLRVPSGSQSGLKLNRPFTVAQGGAVNFTLDFDLRRSLRWSTPRDAFELRPTIRILDTMAVGAVAGEVSNLPSGRSCDDGGVYLFTGNGAAPSDITTAGGPLAVASTRTTVDSKCVYQISFLEPGGYTVAFTWDKALDDPATAQTMTFTPAQNVTVVTSETAKANIALP